MARAPKPQPLSIGRGLLLSWAVAWGLVALAAAMLIAPGAARDLGAGVSDRFAGGKATAARLLVPGDADAPAALAQGIEAALARSGGPRIDILPARDTAAAARDLVAAEADFALVSAAAAPFPEGVAGVATLAPKHLHAIVPATAAARHFRDLKGLRVGTGPEGSAGAALARAVFDHYAFAEPAVLVPTPAAGLRAAFGSGEIDAAVIFDALFAPGVEALLESGYYRLLPIDEAPAIARRLPNTFAETLPPGLYGPDRSLPPVADGPWPTLGAHTLLVARSGAPAQAVRAAAAAVADPANAVLTAGVGPGAGLPLAPHAAVAALRRAGDPAERAEHAAWAVFLAGAVLLAATLPLAMDRQRRLRAWRSRRALQRPFSAVADYAAAIEAADSPHALATILHDMAGALRRVERLWLSGEVASAHMANLYAAHAIQAQAAHGRIAQFHLHRLAAYAGAADAAPIPGDLAPAPARAATDEPGEAREWWPREDNLAHTFEAWGGADAALLETVRVRGRESHAAPATARAAAEDPGDEDPDPADAPSGHAAENPGQSPGSPLENAAVPTESAAEEPDDAPQPRAKRRGKRRRRRNEAANTADADPAPNTPAPTSAPEQPKRRVDQLDLF